MNKKVKQKLFVLKYKEKIQKMELKLFITKQYPRDRQFKLSKIQVQMTVVNIYSLI